MKKAEGFHRFPPEIQRLRAELRPYMPAAAFRPQKGLFFSFAAAWLANIILTVALLRSTGFWAQALASLALGFSWTITSFYAHVFIHGHMVKSKSLQKLLALPCMYFTLISPTFWSHWHRLHHRFGTLDENVSGFQTINWIRHPRLKRFFDSLKPNQSKAISFIHLFHWKAVAFAANQIFYFVHPRFEKHIQPYRMAAELIALLAVHAWVWSVLSWEQIFFIEILPWTVQNFSGSLFVVTNHHPKLITGNLCFQNTCSVHLWRPFWDGLFLNIGYHTEHHIFPECNPGHIHKVSELLTQRYPTQYRRISLFEAIRVIFTDEDLSAYPAFKRNRKI